MARQVLKSPFGIPFEFFCHAYLRLFWNGFAVFCLITLQELFPPPSSASSEDGGGAESGGGANKGWAKETIKDLLGNSLGLRFLICLVVLWGIHGYIFYGTHHMVRQPVFF